MSFHTIKIKIANFFFQNLYNIKWHVFLSDFRSISREFGDNLCEFVIWEIFTSVQRRSKASFFLSGTNSSSY